MKKIILFLLLTVSTNVMAEWTYVGGSADGDNTVYVDFGTIKKKGNKVKMWRLDDFKTVQLLSDNTRFFSTVGRDEYDCEEETIKWLAIYWYSGNMSNGGIVLSLPNETASVPKSFPPRSVAEIIFNIACGKK